MYSPMSDSRHSMPWAPSTWFISISSLTIDLPLITCLAARRRAIDITISLAWSTVSAQCTCTPLRVRLASSRSSRSGSLDKARARTALPRARKCSRSWASLKDAARLVINESMALRKLFRSCVSAKASWARSRKSSSTATVGISVLVLIAVLRCVATRSWQDAGRAGPVSVFPASR